MQRCVGNMQSRPTMSLFKPLPDTKRPEEGAGSSQLCLASTAALVSPGVQGDLRSPWCDCHGTKGCVHEKGTFSKAKPILFPSCQCLSGWSWHHLLVKETALCRTTFFQGPQHTNEPWWFPGAASPGATTHTSSAFLLLQELHLSCGHGSYYFPELSSS